MLHVQPGKNNPRPPLLHTQRCIQSFIPAYKQKLKQEVPVTRSIRKWSDDADATLQDCFDSADWNMFQDSSNGIEEYTTSVIGFIKKYIDDVVPTVTVRTYLNQKPWITGNIRIELKARAAAFKERETNPDAYKKSRYALRRTINKQSVNTASYYPPLQPVCSHWLALTIYSSPNPLAPGHL